MHWIRGGYIITAIDPDKGYQEMELETTDTMILRQLRDDIRSEGREVRQTEERRTARKNAMCRLAYPYN